MASPGGMHNLTTLIKRLEAATLRLEDIASSAQPIEASNATPFVGAAALGQNVEAPAQAAQSSPLPPSIQAFDTMVEDDLQPFSDLSDKLGGLVAEQGAAFCKAFKAQRQVLIIASKSKEPDIAAPVYLEILNDLQQEMEAVNNVREQNPKSAQDNQLAMVAEGISMLAWVTIKPHPEKHVADVLGGAQLYGNRVLTAFKDKGTQDVDWVRSFVKLAGSLIQFIKQFYFPKGLEWNAEGVSPEEALKEARTGTATVNGTPAPPVATSSGLPPPPPPPPLPTFDAPLGASTPNAGGGDMGAVFMALNRGESVTSGLKKVDQSEMTHKNPSLRAASSVPAAPVRSDSSSSTRSKSPMPNKKPESLRTKKPAKKELEGNKWAIENFDNEKTPIEIDAEKNQSILISRCKNATIKVNGKANAISIDNCSRLDVLVESLVSAVDVIKAANFRLQILGTLPSIQLDQVDGATIFLSKDSLSTEVLTSKCTAVNITIPPKGDDDDSVECPVPEQIKSSIVDGKLVSEIVKQEG